MSEQTTLPSIEERQAFARKLGEFRITLPQNEQRMLDAVVIAAFAPPGERDVQGYQGFYYGPQLVPPTSSPNPWWYNGSGAAAWDRTPWGTAIGDVPYYPGVIQ
jgi:hypothetical protein